MVFGISMLLLFCIAPILYCLYFIPNLHPGENKSSEEGRNADDVVQSSSGSEARKGAQRQRGPVGGTKGGTNPGTAPAAAAGPPRPTVQVYRTDSESAGEQRPK